LRGNSRQASIGVEWPNKPDAQYTDCVVPTLQGCALNPTVSQTQRKVSADNVLEA
jgi:hypothetical protein